MRLRLTCGAAGVLAVVGVFACAPAAQAALTHKPLFQLGEIPAVGPHGEPVALPGPLRQMESATVDSGHLWVAEGTYLSTSRIDELDAATGAFIAQPVHVEAPTQAEQKLPTGYGFGYGEGIAVEHGPGEAVVYAGGEVHGVSVVSVFDEAGTLKGTWNGAATPGGSFGIITEQGGAHVGTVTDVAVDNSTDPLNPGRGDVFVAVGSRGIIDVFHPEVDGEERYVGQITGVSPSEPFKDAPRIAVDEANGDLFVLDQGENAVDVFEPTGLGTYGFVRKLAGPPPNGAFHGIYTLAVDSGTGEVYVTEFPPNEQPYRIDQFSATGAYVGQVEKIPDAFAIPVDPVSHDLYVRNVVYGPDLVIPDVTTSTPSNLKPESAVLSGTVNPDGAGNATCEFEWGTSPSFGKVAPCPGEVADGSSAVAVQVPLGGLERDTTYYYRLRATNANGANLGEAWQDQSFTTPGAVLRKESVADVTATSVTFEATINPERQPTSYYFQYGPSAAYGQQAPVPPEAIGSGSMDVDVPSLHVQGLSPSTVYHYRVVVVSEVRPGEVETVDGEDRTFTTQAAGGAFSLLDGRQWELVSPPSKLGALIEPLGFGAMQASAAGDAIAFRTSLPTESEPQGYASAETVLATRGAGGWSSRGISPPHDQSAGSLKNVGFEFQAFSADLSRSIVTPVSSGFTPLSAEASESTTYLRSDYPVGNVEARCSSSCYRPLVTGKPGYANVPPGTVFGEEPEGVCKERTCGPVFQGANPDLSHVVISSPVQLTEALAPVGGRGGLYEWSAGRLQLVGVLPKGEAGPAVLAGRGSEGAAGARHAVSDDGGRVILEGGVAGGNGLYLRENAMQPQSPIGEKGECTVPADACTVRLDVPQGGAGPSAGVSYMTASSDASRVFFIDSGHLTASSSAGGEDLYEYDLGAPAGSRLTDLTVDPNPGEAAGVVQVIGASEDGSYVYFLAGGVLAEGARAGALNLYVRHAGATKLVATLSSEDYEALYQSSLFGRVSPDGGWLAFMSHADLTGYDTRDAVSGHPDAEVYLYDAASGRLVCASCNPTGARPVGIDMVEYSDKLVGVGLGGQWVAGSVPRWSTLIAAGRALGTFDQPRYLSDGGRLFFNSADALVAQDVDGTEDVYEYEPVGVGGCGSSSAAFAPRADGCLGLVSSGTSPTESGFLDASETGGDVFFLTQARLVGQDYDAAYDLYDAQECTSAVPCLPVAAPQPPACVTEASCKAAPAQQPALYGAPASATFSGTGNLAPGTPVAQPKPKSKPKPKRKAKARCGKRRSRRRCAKAGRARRGSQVKAGAVKSRRGGKR